MKRTCFLQPSHCDGERIATLVKMSARPSPPSQPLALGRHIFMHKYCPCDVYGETDTGEWEFHGPGTQAACPGRKPTDIRNGTAEIFFRRKKKKLFCSCCTRCSSDFRLFNGAAFHLFSFFLVSFLFSRSYHVSPPKSSWYSCTTCLHTSVLFVLQNDGKIYSGLTAVALNVGSEVVQWWLEESNLIFIFATEKETLKF